MLGERICILRTMLQSVVDNCTVISCQQYKLIIGTGNQGRNLCDRFLARNHLAAASIHSIT